MRLWQVSTLWNPCWPAWTQVLPGDRPVLTRQAFLWAQKCLHDSWGARSLKQASLASSLSCHSLADLGEVSLVCEALNSAPHSAGIPVVPWVSVSSSGKRRFSTGISCFQTVVRRVLGMSVCICNRIWAEMEKRKHTDLCAVPDLSRAPWFLIHFTYKLPHESFSKYTHTGTYSLV